MLFHHRNSIGFATPKKPIDKAGTHPVAIIYNHMRPVCSNPNNSRFLSISAVLKEPPINYYVLLTTVTAEVVTSAEA